MKTYLSWIIVGIAVIFIIGSMVYYASGPGQYDRFATCIKTSGATFYGAFWCPHCQQQKTLFGKSWTKLPYVECSTPDGKDQTQACKSAGIAAYPTWYFPKTGTTTGVQTLDQLSTFTGCPVTRG